MAVSGIPVVNAKGELEVAITVRDMRAIVEHKPDLELRKPILDFLKEMKARDDLAVHILHPS